MDADRSSFSQYKDLDSWLNTLPSDYSLESDLYEARNSSNKAEIERLESLQEIKYWNKYASHYDKDVFTELSKVRNGLAVGGSFAGDSYSTGKTK